VHAGGERAGNQRVRLVDPHPSAGRLQGWSAEAKFTSSSGGVRAPSVNAKKGLSGEERNETALSRFK